MKIRPSHWIPDEPRVVRLTRAADLDRTPDVAFELAQAPDGLPLALHVRREVDVRGPVLAALRHPEVLGPSLEQALAALQRASEGHTIGRRPAATRRCGSSSTRPCTRGRCPTRRTTGRRSASVALPTAARVAWRELIVGCLATDAARRPRRGGDLAGRIEALLGRWELPGRLAVDCGPASLRRTLDRREPLWVLEDSR